MSRLVGTDMSIRVCRSEGYPVVQMKGNTMDPNAMYDLTISCPRHWTGAGRPKHGIPRNLLYNHDVFTSYHDMWKAFVSKGEGIKSYCDFDNCPLPSPTQEPTY